MDVRSYWHLNSLDLHLGGNSAMPTPTRALNPGEFCLVYTERKNNEEKRLSLLLTLERPAACWGYQNLGHKGTSCRFLWKD